MEIMKPNNNMAWGVSLLVFGLLFLLKKIGIFPAAVEAFIFDWRNILLVIGAAFIFTRTNYSIGILILLLWIFLYLKNYIYRLENLSGYIWPLILVIAGIFLVYNAKSGRRKK